VVNFDLGERFPRPRSQQWGSLRPCGRRVAVLGLGAGGGRPLPLRGSGGLTPGKIVDIFDAKSRFWGQFGPENKLIEGQPNEYDVICRNAQCWRSTCGQRYLPERVLASKYFPKRRSTAFLHHYTPALN